MRLFGFVIGICRERQLVQLTANIRKLRAERNHYKRLYEDLHQRFMEDIHIDGSEDIEEAFARFEQHCKEEGGAA